MKEASEAYNNSEVFEKQMSNKIDELVKVCEDNGIAFLMTFVKERNETGYEVAHYHMWNGEFAGPMELMYSQYMMEHGCNKALSLMTREKLMAIIPQLEERLKVQHAMDEADNAVKQ